MIWVKCDEGDYELKACAAYLADSTTVKKSIVRLTNPDDKTGKSVSKVIEWVKWIKHVPIMKGAVWTDDNLGLIIDHETQSYESATYLISMFRLIQEKKDVVAQAYNNHKRFNKSVSILLAIHYYEGRYSFRFNSFGFGHLCFHRDRLSTHLTRRILEWDRSKQKSINKNKIDSYYNKERVSDILSHGANRRYPGEISKESIKEMKETFIKMFGK